MTSVEDARSIIDAAQPITRPITIRRPAKEARPSGRATHTGAVPRATAVLQRRRRWERTYRGRLRLNDALLVVAVIAAVGSAQVLWGESLEAVLRNGTLLAALWYVALSGLRSREAAIFGAGATEYKRVFNATGVAFGALAIIGVVLDWQGLSTLLLAGLPLGVLVLLAGRWTWRHWLQAQRRRGRYASRTLVVGDRDDVAYVIGTLEASSAVYGHHVVGATFLDANALEVTVGTETYPVLGNVNTVAEVARQLSADTIVVANRPEGDPDFIKHLSWQLEGTAAELVLSSRLTDVAGPRVSFVPVEGLPLIRVEIPTYQGSKHILKRALDIAVSALALIPIALITPILAALITLDSPGPVFFRQERVGRDGQRFRMVKFRSMSTTAEKDLAALMAQNEGAGPLFKMKNDPRVTRVGRILRKLSLDELPQFWNVLIGDMSVVGPRPPLPSETVEYDGTVSRRLYIKPGITGLWQVSGRSDLSWDESVRLDLRYVENWSVLSDLQIMWRTAKVMVQPSGAY